MICSNDRSLVKDQDPKEIAEYEDEVHRVEIPSSKKIEQLKEWSNVFFHLTLYSRFRYKYILGSN
jgi:hypothetical protein